MRGYRGAARQRGIGLVELMIAMILGILVIGGVMQVFISSKSAYRLQESLSRLQENGRFAVDFIAQDLRMAGYQGCLSMIPVGTPGTRFSYTLNDHPFFKFSQAVQGYNANSGSGWTPTLNAAISAAISAAGTPLPSNQADVLSINTSSRVAAGLSASMASTTAALSLSASGGLQAGDVVVVADCEATAVTQVTALTGSGPITLAHDVDGAQLPKNTTADLGKAFGPDATLYRGTITTYYIAPSAADASLPVLWELVSTPADAGTPRELIEGVEGMEVLYGVDTDGDRTANRYVNAAALIPPPSPLSWENVIAVYVSLLLHTAEDHLVSEAQAYTFNGVAVSDPGDRRLRRVFTTTVGVRNSLQ